MNIVMLVLSSILLYVFNTSLTNNNYETVEMLLDVLFWVYLALAVFNTWGIIAYVKDFKNAKKVYYAHSSTITTFQFLWSVALTSGWIYNIYNANDISVLSLYVYTSIISYGLWFYVLIKGEEINV